MHRWKTKLTEYGIGTTADNGRVIGALLGAPQVNNDLWAKKLELSRSRQSSVAVHEEVAAALVDCAERYATVIQRVRTMARVTTHLASFQSLVFVSFCYVLLQYGVPEEIVNSMMRTNISNSLDKSLSRLRSGAV